ncbi:MAG TPA: T9SS type A sorting domain-containing protein, partial [Ignavibacteria bacterium]|nr:T9SS type A sorting domain-containing protein [Ignavibacteria bacterium]
SVEYDSLYGPSFTEYKLSGIPVVNSYGINGKGVIVGILDDGFHWKNHESLDTRNVIAEYNFVFHDSSTAWQPGDSPISGDHGTFVFSLIGGYKPGEIIGPAHDASFILAKTEDDRSETHIEEDNYAAALQWMESLGVDITTSSLGYSIFDDSTYSYTYQDMNGKTTIVTKAAELAFKRGVLTFTAAGNEGNTKWHYIVAPADGFNILAVGAVDSNNRVTSFSSRGPTSDGRIKPDIMAMGSNNYGASSAGFNSYDYGSGTSFATPIASGVAAMLLSVYPKLTNVEARDIILKTSGNADNPNNVIGYGLISAKKVITYPVLFQNSSNSSVSLYKIFFPSVPIQPSSVKLHYTINNNKNFITEKPSFDGKLKYIYTFPSLPKGELISFYYTYTDNAGTNYRVPKNDFYNFSSGDWRIIVNVPSELIPDNYILSQNYPNPFNGYTYINFVSKSVQHAKVMIFNLLGQKIDVLFNGDTIVGENIISWDGKYQNGTTCASGVYFYVLSMGGKQYVNKMVFQK